MLYYDSEAVYIESGVDLAAKIVRIDAILCALESAALKAAAGEDISEYWLDDGQTKIKATRRGANGIATSILAFERIRQRYLNQLNGRVFRFVDIKNFTG
jgi:tRNA(Ser,Leu) C12 N-acetylase TAN1